MFSVIPGTVNTQGCTVSQSGKKKSGRNMSEDKVLESDHLPQVPDMPITGSGHELKVTFRNPIVRLRSVSSTPCMVPQPVSFDLSGISNTETSGKDTDSEAEGRPKAGNRSSLTPHQNIRRMRHNASITSQSLQLVADEFRKIHEPKIKI